MSDAAPITQPLEQALFAYHETKTASLALDEAVVWVGWQDEEDELIGRLAMRLQLEDRLQAFWRGSRLYVRLDGEEHLLPLTMSRHDRYVALSSLARLLADSHSFFLLRASLDEPRQGLLALSRPRERLLRARLDAAFARLLVRMRLGHDYFFSIDVPWLGNEGHNPRFEAERDEVTRQIEQARTAEGLDAGLSKNFNRPPAGPWWKFWS